LKANKNKKLPSLRRRGWQALKSPKALSE